jgi:hypothetical protein
MAKRTLELLMCIQHGMSTTSMIMLINPLTILFISSILMLIVGVLE